MNEIEKQILEEYARRYKVASASYKLLGIMLDEKYVEGRIKQFGIKKMYIYGGTYMAVQLYRVSKGYVDIRGIVDKAGKIVLSDTIPVMMLDEFEKKYDGEKVVITSINFFKEIKKDIETFVDAKDVIYIGELLIGEV